MTVKCLAFCYARTFGTPLFSGCMQRVVSDKGHFIPTVPVRRFILFAG